ncbi:MAG: phosphoribosylformylglycinamidine synthase subunit PurL [Planctomycetes bacterium]|nr:phosphoribosylformylglycinamidine synthase subunit PurL [Planctomycetota bacterium]
MLLLQVEVSRRKGFPDPLGARAESALKDAGERVQSARFVQVYLFEGDLAPDAGETLARELLADPVTEVYSVGKPLAPLGEGARTLTIARRPGVMDPAENSLAHALALLGLPPARVKRARKYHFRFAGGPGPDLSNFARRHLANDLIEEITTGNRVFDHLPAGRPWRFERVEVPLAGKTERELEDLSREMGLALDPLEMAAAQRHFAGLGRAPTDVELETIAQTWSEHCCHKTLTGPIDFEGERIENLLKETIFRATRELEREWCVSVFSDNAGVVRFDEEHDLAIKVETHNHPSALEPYGGAATGVGGVIRDVLGCGLGAWPVANLDVFCVGPLDLPAEKVPRGCLHPRRILEGVVSGVRDYGNQMGIPTAAGALVVGEGYVANPLVFCGTVGLLPRGKAAKSVKPGDAIVLAGGRTGRDGIHGATMSSLSLDATSERLSGGAVQIGDPITEKRLADTLVQARDAGLYRSLTDCGAGGLSSAVGEMAHDTGAEVHLERVPLKYEGLSSREIWISEAQERMVLAVPPENVQASLALFAGEGVEATVLGRFTDSGRLALFHDGHPVADLELEFLHHGLPKRVRKATWKAPPAVRLETAGAGDPGEILAAVLAHPDVASKEWIVRGYDHEVQAGSVAKPLVGFEGTAPSDAAVFAPVPGGKSGVALGLGIASRYGRLDPAAMAASAIDEAVRNVVAAGADPDRIALLDNFAWADCRREEELGALVVAARACYEVAKAFGTPFVSGKDSLHNEYTDGGTRIGIPPTLLVTALGVVTDLARAVSMDFKGPGHLVYLVGRTHEELGGSIFASVARLSDGTGTAPQVHAEEAQRTFEAVGRLIREGLVLACHDLSEGGLAVAAAEMAFARDVGAELDLASVPRPPGAMPDAAILFSESNSRFLVEVDLSRAARVEEVLAGVPHAGVGRTVGKPELVIRGTGGAALLREPIEPLRRAWSESLGRRMGR